MESTTTAPEAKKMHHKTREKIAREQATGTVEEVGLPDGVEVVKPNVDSEYKIEVIKDYHGNVDPFYLSKKDPRYAYRFLRDERKNLSLSTGNMLFNYGGWQLCDRQHLLRIGIAERFIADDGLYRVGDTILAFIPKELYEEKMQHEKRKADEKMEAIQQTLTEGQSVPGIDIRLQTKKQLRGDWGAEINKEKDE